MSKLRHLFAFFFLAFLLTACVPGQASEILNIKCTEVGKEYELASYSSLITASSASLKVVVEDPSVASARISFGYSFGDDARKIATVYVTPLDCDSTLTWNDLVRTSMIYVISNGQVIDTHYVKITHFYNAYTIEDNTCTEDGLDGFTCPYCKRSGTYVREATGHDDGEWKETKPATCTEDGLKERLCTKCDTSLESAAIPATGHDDGEWKETKPATCTEDGLKERLCTKCDASLESAAIPATGHDDGEWKETKPATCKEDGLKEKHCTKCDAVLASEAIPAANTEHVPGEMTVVSKPTCTEKGKQTQTCTVCGETLASEEIPALGHTESDWQTTQEPTCAAVGKKVKTCTVCGETTAKEDIPALPHDDGKWVDVKKATRTEKGERHLKCTQCGTVLATEEIPMITIVYYPKNTACSIGPRFRDLENAMTSKWYMFTPVDLSIEGTQTFDLLAANCWVIGEVNVTVSNGNVTITYELVSSQIRVDEEFLTLFDAQTMIASVDPADLPQYAFGEPISIAETLGDSTKACIYIRNVVNYTSETYGITRFEDDAAYKEKVEAMLTLLAQ